jgi:hypothetical protein
MNDSKSLAGDGDLPKLPRERGKGMSKLNFSEVMEAATNGDGTGFCIACGSEQQYCEPDASEYDCDDCGESKVYGAEQILLMGLV